MDVQAQRPILPGAEASFGICAPSTRYPRFIGPDTNQRLLFAGPPSSPLKLRLQPTHQKLSLTYGFKERVARNDQLRTQPRQAGQFIVSQIFLVIRVQRS